MTRILCVDLETTGLDLQKDKILKFGMILIEVDEKTPIFEREYTLWSDHYPEIDPGASQVHGILKRHVVEFGTHPSACYQELADLLDNHSIEYVMAHNGHNFDFPLIASNMEAFNPAARSAFDKLKKIDTIMDLSPDLQGRKLIHLAAEHGFLNPFPHSALSDIRTMIELFRRYEWSVVKERAASKIIMARAIVSYDERDKAKARKFFWDGKKWIKRIKACDLEKEKQLANFIIEVGEL